MARATIRVSDIVGGVAVGAENVAGAGTEYRQTMQLGGLAAAELADVKNAAPAAAAYGLVSRAMLYDAAGNALQQQQPTYHALGRLAARPYALSYAATLNSRKQILAIAHTAASTKLVKIRRVLIALESVSVAGLYVFDLVRITSAPATGNPAITPTPALQGDPAAEVTVLALPTTAGTEGTVVNSVEFNQGITGAAPTVNPPNALNWYELFSEDEQNPVGEQRGLSLRAGVLEGYAIVCDASAAGTVKCLARFVFTEQ